jgi:hypothetical protein
MNQARTATYTKAQRRETFGPPSGRHRAAQKSRPLETFPAAKGRFEPISIQRRRTGAYQMREKTNMLNARWLCTFALLVPALAAAFPAEAAPKRDTAAIRAECFRQANEAAASAGVGAAVGTTGERNALGYSAYRACAQKHGIRP